MKKKTSNKVIKFVFLCFFMSFLVIYFSELTGYYEYQNYKKSALTESQIRAFEEDVKSGKEVDLEEYITVTEISYDNTLSRVASKCSNGISKIVQGGIASSFKYLSKLIDD